MLVLSPSRWLEAKSPASATLTLRSLISCVLPSGPERVTRTTWVSALPYWLSPRTIVKLRSSIRRVAEGAQQERHVQVTTGVFEVEHHGDLRVKGAEARPFEVGPSGEIEP